MQQEQLGIKMEVARKRLSVKKANADLRWTTASSSTTCLSSENEFLAPLRTSSSDTPQGVKQEKTVPQAATLTAIFY